MSNTAMSNIEVNGKELPTDEEGYLNNLSDWEPENTTKNTKSRRPYEY